MLHVVEPVESWNVPAGQLEQVVAPTPLDAWPATLATHSLAVLALECRPVEHDVQITALDEEYIPAAQEEQDKEPPLLWYLPAMQLLEQDDDPGAEYVRVAHTLQLVAPMLAW